MFWSDFHKTSEDPNCLTKEHQCKNNNIFGRQASNPPNVERNFASKADINFSVKKVAIKTREGNTVFGLSCKFSKYDVNLTSRKRFGYPKQMHATNSVTKGHNYGISQTPREKSV